MLGGAIEGILAAGGADIGVIGAVLGVDKEGGAIAGGAIDGGGFNMVGVGGGILVVCVGGAAVGMIGGAADIVGTAGCDITGGAIVGLNSVGDG